jgi:hypothetical protein
MPAVKPDEMLTLPRNGGMTLKGTSANILVGYPVG